MTSDLYKSIRKKSSLLTPPRLQNKNTLKQFILSSSNRYRIKKLISFLKLSVNSKQTSHVRTELLPLESVV